ncbi:ROK family transcriptional regulator [Gordoniibacillus kamchatkensis]|uniref:ROK family transcriptional regulator n=1 Tax=Gordoniibacillus kamchatkensis TaxID=1590651 RepID=A0ABR5ABJ8_9BACL|nr:ROK family protein [Paenibacillus sp. VKM B-2647]KIL38346.1 ROK family transcriptional regulator [Paenibacillus sp. VKM B-2647]
MTLLGGIDIGGTKCAVTLGRLKDEGIDIVGKVRFPTPDSPAEALRRFEEGLAELLAQLPEEPLAAIGISCGGPLDSRAGLILSPPNLPHWDRIDCVSPLRKRFGVPVGLQNDANACALAEWKWGAGRGCRNMIFLTFGTGMGAGMILDGRLYSGTNDMAGEVGHVRLEHEGPVGYGKAGSFEGFCSGGGIAELGRRRAEEALRAGESPVFCPRPDELHAVTAQKVGEAAERGDALARDILQEVGRKLGRGLAMLVDILNPERIVIGSIYGRQQAILEPAALAVLDNEALPIARSVCKIVPAGLGESVGDVACLSVALNLVVE